MTDCMAQVPIFISGFPTRQPPVCQKGLGLENGAIPDSSITASSVAAPGTTLHIPGNGRLHFKPIPNHYGAWSAGNLRDNSWFQVNFGRFVKVTIISTQGRQDVDQWVTKYRVAYSYDGHFLRNYKEGGYIKVLYDFFVKLYNIMFLPECV